MLFQIFTELVENLREIKSETSDQFHKQLYQNVIVAENSKLTDKLGADAPSKNAHPEHQARAILLMQKKVESHYSDEQRRENSKRYRGYQNIIAKALLDPQVKREYDKLQLWENCFKHVFNTEQENTCEEVFRATRAIVKNGQVIRNEFKHLCEKQGDNAAWSDLQSGELAIDKIAKLGQDAAHAADEKRVQQAIFEAVKNAALAKQQVQVAIDLLPKIEKEVKDSAKAKTAYESKYNNPADRPLKKYFDYMAKDVANQLGNGNANACQAMKDVRAKFGAVGDRANNVNAQYQFLRQEGVADHDWCDTNTPNDDQILTRINVCFDGDANHETVGREILTAFIKQAVQDQDLATFQTIVANIPQAQRQHFQNEIDSGYRTLLNNATVQADIESWIANVSEAIRNESATTLQYRKAVNTDEKQLQQKLATLTALKVSAKNLKEEFQPEFKWFMGGKGARIADALDSLEKLNLPANANDPNPVNQAEEKAQKVLKSYIQDLYDLTQKINDKWDSKLGYIKVISYANFINNANQNLSTLRKQYPLVDAWIKSAASEELGTRFDVSFKQASNRYLRFNETRATHKDAVEELKQQLQQRPKVEEKMDYLLKEYKKAVEDNQNDVKNHRIDRNGDYVKALKRTLRFYQDVMDHKTYAEFMLVNLQIKLKRYQSGNKTTASVGAGKQNWAANIVNQLAAINQELTRPADPISGVQALEKMASVFSDHDHLLRMNDRRDHYFWKGKKYIGTNNLHSIVKNAINKLRPRLSDDVNQRLDAAKQASVFERDHGIKPTEQINAMMTR